MATDYPGGLDSFPLPGANLSTNPHSSLHTDVQDAVEAIQTELGVNPSGSFSTVGDRLAAGTADPGSVTPAKLHQAKIWEPLHDSWVSYNPNFGNFSAGSGAAFGRYKQVGTMCFVHIQIEFESGGAITGVPEFYLPHTPRTDAIVGGVGLFIPNGSKPLGTEVYGFGLVCKWLWSATTSGFWEAGAPLSAGAGGRATADLTFEVGNEPTDSLA